MNIWRNCTWTLKAHSFHKEYKEIERRNYTNERKLQYTEWCCTHTVLGVVIADIKVSSLSLCPGSCHSQCLTAIEIIPSFPDPAPSSEPHKEEKVPTGQQPSPNNWSQELVHKHYSVFRLSWDSLSHLFLTTAQFPCEMKLQLLNGLAEWIHPSLAVF